MGKLFRPTSATSQSALANITATTCGLTTTVAGVKSHLVVMTDPAVHHAGYRCYACSIDVTGKYQNDSKQLISFLEYERVVEHIEAIPPGVAFNRVSVWQALGRGYKLNGIVYHVIRDMYVHGLLVCVRRSGYRCLGYEVRRDLDVPRETRQDTGHALPAGHPAAAPGHC